MGAMSGIILFRAATVMLGSFLSPSGPAHFRFRQCDAAPLGKFLVWSRGWLGRSRRCAQEYPSSLCREWVPDLGDKEGGCPGRWVQSIDTSRAEHASQQLI